MLVYAAVRALKGDVLSTTGVLVLANIVDWDIAVLMTVEPARDSTHKR